MMTNVIALLTFLLITTACSPDAETDTPSSAPPQETPIAEVSETQQTPIPYDKAKIKTHYQDIATLNQSFDTAFSKKDLALFGQTKEKAKKLAQQLDKIELIFHPLHPASSCKSAAIYMESARTQAWSTLNNPNSTDTEKNIDSANMKEFQAALQKCKASTNL